MFPGTQPGPSTSASRVRLTREEPGAHGAFAEADLVVSGWTRAADPSGTEWVISVVRTSDWRGRPYWSSYVVFLGLTRLWRWLRRDHRWSVEVCPAESLDQRGEVRAIMSNRDDAVRRAREVAAEIRTST